MVIGPTLPANFAIAFPEYNYREEDGCVSPQHQLWLDWIFQSWHEESPHLRRLIFNNTARRVTTTFGR